MTRNHDQGAEGGSRLRLFQERRAHLDQSDWIDLFGVGRGEGGGGVVGRISRERDGYFAGALRSGWFSRIKLNQGRSRLDWDRSTGGGAAVVEVGSPFGERWPLWRSRLIKVDQGRSR